MSADRCQSPYDAFRAVEAAVQVYRALYQQAPDAVMVPLHVWRCLSLLDPSATRIFHKGIPCHLSEQIEHPTAILRS